MATAARDLQKLSDGTPLELNRIYLLNRNIDRLWERLEPWLVGSLELERLARMRMAIRSDLIPVVMEAGAVVDRAKTGIDGKYAVSDLPEGDYCLYAHQLTDVFLVEWLLKTSVRGTGGVQQDLSNDNASIIINKSPSSG